MKLNVFWIVAALAPLTSLVVLAQDTAPAAPGAPTTETTPAAPAKKAPSAKKVVLDPPVAATIKSDHINVRGQPSFTGETVGHLQKGDAVTVLEKITLRRPIKGEPAEWAQIVLPAGIPVWVDGEYVDADAKTVKAKRVNLRGGPGENYSLLGRLEKGTAIKEIKTEKGWIAIEAPTNAYAYVAAEYLDMQPAPALAVVAPVPAPTAATTPTPEPQVVNVNTPAAPAVVAATEPTAPAPTAPAPAPAASQQSDTDKELEALHRATAVEAAPVAPATPAPTTTAHAPTAVAPVVTGGDVTPRIVTREGFVRKTYNLQAPTDYELHDLQSGTVTEFLQPAAGQNFKIFVGTRVTVKGSEGMVPRWPRTPVLQVQSVDLMP